MPAARMYRRSPHPRPLLLPPLGVSAVCLAVCLALWGAFAPAWVRAQEVARPPRRAAPAPNAMLPEEARLALPAPAGAVAINGDESMLAAATADGPGRWRVHLFDRPSRGKLGVIEARVGAEPRLRFSPVSDLLLVAGSDALQLWELPIAPLDPGQPLDERHRRWEVRLQAPATQVRIGAAPEQVYWSQGPALFRRDVQSGVAFDGKPLWQPAGEGPPIVDFALAPQEALAALVYAQRKEIGLLELGRLLLQRELQGHRFPVLAARFALGRPLLTLDAGGNLVQWRANTQPVATTFLDQVPERFRAATFADLGENHLLLVGQDGRALAIDGRTARPVAEVRSDGPDRIAVSPTGRYVLAAEGKVLRLYGFAQPLSPLDYVRRLRQLQAYSLAQSYVRLMDDSGLSPQLQADLLNEASRQPPGQQLQQALARLQQAVAEGDLERARYWAEQVLALQPGQPDAVAALHRLREQQDEQVLAQAREAHRLGQHRVAISLLSSQIRDDSRFYPEALELIRQAEARRSVETALTQAREKLNLGDTVAAEALVREALRKDEDNLAAQALMDEIDVRSGAGTRQLAAAGIGLLLAALIVGLLVLRYRRRLEPLARKLRLDEESPPGFPPGRGPARPEPSPGARRTDSAAGAAAGAAAGPSAEPRRPPPEREPPRAAPGDSARRRVLEALAQEIERLLHDLRAADLAGRLKASLMEMEAELSAMQRRVADPTAELGPLHNRLRALLAKARKLPLRPRREAGGPQGPGAEGPRASDERQEPPRPGQGRPEHGRSEQGRSDQGRAEQDRQEQNRAAPPAPESAPGSAATHYEVLQVPPDATPEQIKAAYHKLIKQYHPDLHNASQFDWVRAESERMSRRISEAFRVLGNADSRSRYDRQLRDQAAGRGAAR